METSLHAYFLASTVKRHIRTFKVDIVQRGNFHDISSQLFRNGKLLSSLVCMFFWCHDIPFVCESVLKSVIDPPMVNVGNDNSCSA